MGLLGLWHNKKPTGYYCFYCDGMIYEGQEVFDYHRKKVVAYHHACYDDDIVAFEMHQ